MKKSELRAMIREILKEEVSRRKLKESNYPELDPITCEECGCIVGEDNYRLHTNEYDEEIIVCPDCSKRLDNAGAKMKMYCVDVNNDAGSYELIFEVDGKVAEKKFCGAFENVMIDCYDFFKKCAKKYGLASIENSCEIKLEHTFY